jgi:hypothetical protein
MPSLAAVLAGILVALLLVACGAGSDQEANAPGKPIPAWGAQEALSVGRWRLGVTVTPSRLGPISFAAKDLARAKRTNSDPWIEHDLVFRNSGDRTVTFADTRSSRFLGEGSDSRVLAADQGCGYALNSRKAPATAGACLSYLDLLRVEPDASAKRSITLFKGLRGMDRLAAGTYVFRRPVRFQFGQRMPGEAEGRSAIVRLVYEVEAR